MIKKTLLGELIRPTTFIIFPEYFIITLKEHYKQRKMYKLSIVETFYNYQRKKIIYCIREKSLQIDLFIVGINSLYK